MKRKFSQLEENLTIEQLICQIQSQLSELNKRLSELENIIKKKKTIPSYFI